jgi:hypothetical protein
MYGTGAEALRHSPPAMTATQPIIKPLNYAITETGCTRQEAEACEQGIAREFHKIFDSLANSQVELDAESKEVLYANLWDLYA